MNQPNRQQVQEDQYTFPYHYIPHWHRGRFTQMRCLRWGYEYLSYLGFVLDCLGQRTFRSLLDVGCGDGRLLGEVCRRFGSVRLVGVDTSAAALRLATAFHPDIAFLQGDITSDALLDETFDIVTLIDTLEHIPPENLSAFLDGLDGHLSEGGWLIVTVPSSNVKVRPKHFQHFEGESLAALLESRFFVQETHYLNRKGWRVRLLHRLLTNGLFCLNEKHLVNWLFRYYRKRLLPAGPTNCQRICVICRKQASS